MSKRQKEYSLNVTYDAQLYPEMDNKLEKLIGFESSGSGMGFGSRDVQWYFLHSRDAFEKFKRLRKMKGVLEISLKFNRD